MRKTIRVLGVLALALAFWAPGAQAQEFVQGYINLANTAGLDPGVIDDSGDGFLTVDQFQCFQDASDAGLPGGLQAVLDANIVQAASDVGATTLILAPGGDAAIGLMFTLSVGGDTWDFAGQAWGQGYAEALGGAGICGNGIGTDCDDTNSCDSSCYDYSQSGAALAILSACGLGPDVGGPVDGGGEDPLPGDPFLNLKGPSELGVNRTRTLTAVVKLPDDLSGESTTYTVTVTFAGDDSRSLSPSSSIGGPVEVTAEDGENVEVEITFETTASDEGLLLFEIDETTTTVTATATVTGGATPLSLVDTLDITILYWEWFQGCRPKGQFDGQGGLFAGAFACDITGDKADSIRFMDADKDGVADEYALNLLAYVLCSEAGPGDELKAFDTAARADVAADYAANTLLVDAFMENYGDLADWLVSDSVGIDVSPGSVTLIEGLTAVVTASSDAGDTKFQWDAIEDELQGAVEEDPDTPEIEFKPGIFVQVATRVINLIDSSEATILALKAGRVTLTVRGVGDGTGVDLTTGIGTPTDPAATLHETDVSIRVVAPVEEGEDAPASLSKICGETLPPPRLSSAKAGVRNALKVIARESQPTAGYAADVALVLKLWNVGDLAADPVIPPAKDEATTGVGTVPAFANFDTVNDELVLSTAIEKAVNGIEDGLDLGLLSTLGCLAASSADDAYNDAFDEAFDAIFDDLVEVGLHEGAGDTTRNESETAATIVADAAGVAAATAAVEELFDDSSIPAGFVGPAIVCVTNPPPSGFLPPQFDTAVCLGGLIVPCFGAAVGVLAGEGALGDPDNLIDVPPQLELIRDFASGFSAASALSDVTTGFAGLTKGLQSDIQDIYKGELTIFPSFFSFSDDDPSEIFGTGDLLLAGTPGGLFFPVVSANVVLTEVTAAIATIAAALDLEEGVFPGTFGANGAPGLEAFDAAVDAAEFAGNLLDSTDAAEPGNSDPTNFTDADFDFALYDGGVPQVKAAGDTIFNGDGNISDFSYGVDPDALVTHAELAAVIFKEEGGLRIGKEDFVNAAAQLSPFFPGNPEVPVAGIIGLGLLAGACAVGGASLLRRKKS